MCDWEEIKKTLNHLGEVFVSNWWNILSYSFILLLSLPIIKWFILSTFYMIFKTPSLLEKFGESTAFSLLPWWIDFLIEPVKTLEIYILLIILMTCIFALLNNNNT
ncbi:hypothetical protein HYV50_04190 [Candidatus Pacearchaeota archaeon]|nr:hypothetical protein [Candidatus Pacearchaeota archaeon]